MDNAIMSTFLCLFLESVKKEIINLHGFKYYLYADDFQISISRPDP